MRTFLLSTILLFAARAYSQQGGTTFSIQGVTIPGDTGTMLLMPVNTEDYYPFHRTLETPVRGGRFSFTDSIAYPTAYMLGLKYGSAWKYLSSPFYIEPGVQTLSCNVDTMWGTPAVTNPTMDEYRDPYHRNFDSYAAERSQYDRLQDSLNTVYRGKATTGELDRLSTLKIEMNQTYYRTLLSYAKNHPASYVALWELVNSLNSGYDPLFDSIYAAFSAPLRKTYTGKILAQKLATARFTCIGCRFPDLYLANLDDLARKGSIFKTRGKYTLVDFWFSHCGVCIEEFPQLKDIYAGFNGKGFALVGISTDGRGDVPEWKKVIGQFQLPWPQYLDENGVMARQCAINTWPSNFLLDGNGVIIQKNIEPATLKLFLNDHLLSR